MSATLNTVTGVAEDSAALKSAVRKFYVRMMPLVVIMLLVNQVDRTNLGFIQDALKADLGLGAAAFGLGAGLFFVGYALFEVPSNMLLQRYGARIWLTRIMVTWGLVTLLMAFTQGEYIFYFLRFMLGLMEAGFFPGVIFYLTSWLPDAHRGRAVAIFLSASALAYIVTGPISGALLTMHGMAGIAGWRWMFLIEGGGSMLMGLVSIRYLVSNIAEAKWLTAEEKHELQSAVTRDIAGRKTAQGEKPQWRLLLQRPVLTLCGIYFVSVMTGYTVTFWLPGILRQIKDINDFQVGLLSSIPWIGAVIAMYVLARFTDDKGHRKVLVGAALLLQAVGMALATTGSPWFALFALTLAAIGYKSCNSVFWSMTAMSLEPKILASGIALINSLGNLGGFVAPTAVGAIKQHTGSLQAGLLGLTACSLVGMVLVASLRLRKGV